MKQYLNRSEIGKSRKFYLDRVNSLIFLSGNERPVFSIFLKMSMNITKQVKVPCTPESLPLNRAWTECEGKQGLQGGSGHN